MTREFTLINTNKENGYVFESYLYDEVLVVIANLGGSWLWEIPDERDCGLGEGYVGALAEGSTKQQIFAAAAKAIRGIREELAA